MKDWRRFERGVPLEVEYVHRVDMASVSIRNLAFHPAAPMRRLPRSRLRRWWLKRSGWVLYGDDGQLL